MSATSEKKKKKKESQKEDAPQSQFLGHYQLGQVIGKGAAGTVYKAINILNGDFVAIKEIPITNVSEIDNIQYEITLLKTLKHPNIVKYLDTIKTKDNLNIITEYVENGSLQSLVKKFGRIPESLAKLYVSHTLNGLIYLHDQGVIHRDIKGANILVANRSGHVKLADFGVSTKISEKGKTGDDDVAGTPYWMAPEIIELSGAQLASDIWSLGCTVIELLTGAPPYFDLAPFPALYRITQDDHPPLPSGISPALEDFLMKSFQKNPSLRATAKQLMMHPWLAGGPSPSTTGGGSGIDMYQKIMEFKKKYLQHTEGSAAAEEEKELDEFEDEPTEEEKEEGFPKPKDEGDNNNDDDDDDPFAGIDDDDDPFGDDDEKPASSSSSSTKAKPVMATFSSPEAMVAALGAKASSSLSSLASSSLSSSTSSTASILSTAAPPGTDTASSSSSKKSWSIADFVEDGDDDDDFGDLEGSDLRARFEEKKKKEEEEEEAGGDFTEMAEDDDWGEDDALANLETTVTNDAGMDEETEAKRRAECDVIDEAQRLIQQLDTGVSSQLGDQLVKPLKRLNELVERSIVPLKEKLISWHAVLPLMEIVDQESPNVKVAVLMLMNSLIRDNAQMQNTMGMMGAFPVVISNGSTKQPLAVREEASKFVETLLISGGESTIQMFVASRCLAGLCDMLDAEWKTSRTLVMRAVRCVYVLLAHDKLRDKKGKKDGKGKGGGAGGYNASGVIAALTNSITLSGTGLVSVNTGDSQKPILLRNDLCRLFCKSNLLSRLTRHLKQMNSDAQQAMKLKDVPSTQKSLKITSSSSSSASASSSSANSSSSVDITLSTEVYDILLKTVEIISIFANNDKAVSVYLSKSDTLPPLLDEIPRIPDANMQLNLVTSLRFVCMNQDAMVSLEAGGVIDTLVAYFRLMKENSKVQNQLVMAVFYLSLLSPRRCELFAVSGVIPILQSFVTSGSAVAQLALTVLLTMPRAGSRGRAKLWEADGVGFYLSQINTQRKTYSETSVFEVLSTWMSFEKEKVGTCLAQEQNLKRLLLPFTRENTQLTVNELSKLLPNLQEMLSMSPTLNTAVGKCHEMWLYLLSLFDDAVVCQSALLLNSAVRIVSHLYERHSSPKELISSYKLYPLMQRLQKDQHIMVAELASKLLVALGANDVI
ncbi:putative ste ste11 cdc15 protein kinase [Monocercomonoides exilis]|uniref:putative ste ste11 cdc15 protein kinase n=1 Tax=Monocercomonoides exilis TaxID=2049356 RepID=UPI0035594CF8|nr:putative ste ste11 cdc15 protein kinase [Monocercomonoides exilis]|eukprot:MONOS_3930.1-p1 / transcript=MONOS_3930.1 / gene=MONOS_3930 / organism=Monocercomonoides_exilis_PA203 / gene_product=ser / transcript_product=ser / location=Mono_scaffold00098:13956-17645(+) / protein_length=1161 / sequence_SO=supercontig / SO=protein_coding / is_pseudo=false